MVLNAIATTTSSDDDDDMVMAYRLMALASSSSSATATTSIISRRRARIRQQKWRDDQDISLSSSSGSSEGYEEEEDSDVSLSSWMWNDNASVHSTRHTSRMKQEEELERSHLQASFAERTALEMKQLLEWWTCNLTQVPEEDVVDGDDHDDTEEALATPLTLVTSFEESDDLDVLQCQALPHNSLVLLDCEILEDDDDDDHEHLCIASTTTTSTAPLNPTSTPNQLSNSSWNIVSAYRSLQQNHLAAANVPASKFHNIPPNVASLLQLLQGRCSIHLPSTTRCIQPTLKALSSFLGDHPEDWQGVAQLQTLQVNALCHETQHMADILTELTDATCSTSCDDDDSDDDDGRDDQGDKGNTVHVADTTNRRKRLVREDAKRLLPKRQSSASFQRRTRHAYCSSHVENDHDDNDKMVVQLQWNDMLQLWLYQLQCRLQMSLLQFALHYLIPLQVLSVWVWWQQQDKQYHESWVVGWANRAIQRLGRLAWKIVTLLIIWQLVMRGMWGWTRHDDPTACRSVVSCKGIQDTATDAVPGGVMAKRPLQEMVFSATLGDVDHQILLGAAYPVWDHGNGWVEESLLSSNVLWGGTRALL